MKICVGGTFDRLHIGHKALIDRAFQSLPDNNRACRHPRDQKNIVYIGISTDELIHHKKRVAPYSERVCKLESYLKQRRYKNYHIIPLTSQFGTADTADFDEMVVSRETYGAAQQINIKRKKNGLKPLQIYLVETVYGQDLIRVSSTRIKRGEIDADGHRLKPLLVNVGSMNKNKIAAVETVFMKCIPGCSIKICGKKVDTGVSEQPFEEDTIKGAIKRAEKAICNADFGVGIEAGLFLNPVVDKYTDVQFCAVMDSTGELTLGHGSGFCYPKPIIDCVLRGGTVSDAFRDIYGTPDIGHRQGAIGYLTKGLLTRKELTEQSVFMAMVPRIFGSVRRYKKR